MTATHAAAHHLAAHHLAALTSSAEAGILIGLGIPFCICAAAAIIVWAYFRLQAHRADAVAMAEYRKLAEEAVAGSTWRAAGFLAGYVFLAGWLLFAIAFTTTVTATVFMITLAGIPLLVGAAAVLRGC